MKPSRKEEYSLGDTISTEDGVLRVGPVRGVLLTESAFVFLQRVIHENMPELVKYGFYEMGYRAGIDFARTAAGAGESREEAFRHLVETYRQSGYGDIEVVQFDLGQASAVLRGRNLIEASAATTSGIYPSPRCVDHYSRGMFAGLLSSLLGREVICEELACQYRGDEVCEFHMLGYGA